MQTQKQAVKTDTDAMLFALSLQKAGWKVKVYCGFGQRYPKLVIRKR